MKIHANIYKAIRQKLGKKSLFYVCRDLERAIFTKKLPEQVFIITNHTNYSKKIAAKEKNIILIKAPAILDTAELLRHAKTKKTIRPNDFVLVFKNSSLIEKIADQKNWQLVNPPAGLSDEVEGKVSQVKWLGELKSWLPQTRIQTLKDVKWNGKKFIVQFNRTHTGSGTHLITGATALNKLKRVFPKRPARIVRFVDGPIITMNNIVWGKKIMFGNPSYQITGLKPFTDNPFATIGNDWGFAKDFLGKDQLMQVKAIARDVSNKLRRDGWVGLYGIDVVFSRGRAYLLEINARQPASASFESVLQENGRRQENQVSVFEAHLGAILGVAPDFKMIKLNSGAQIIKRNTGSSLTETQKQKIVAELPGFNIIFYQNKKAESDQARCQTENTLIKKHGILNEQGEQVRKKFS